MRAIGLWRIIIFYTVMGSVGLLAMSDKAQHLLWLPEASLEAWGRCLGLGLLAGFGLVTTSRWAGSRLAWGRTLVNEFRHWVDGLAPWEVLVIAVCSGLSEEMLFRGALQPALGVTLTTLIFALLHIGPNPRFIPWTFMALVGGIIFGSLLIWTGNLVAPVLAHVTVNFLNLRFLSLDGRRVEMHLSPARS